MCVALIQVHRQVGAFLVSLIRFILRQTRIAILFKCRSGMSLGRWSIHVRIGGRVRSELVMESVRNNQPPLPDGEPAWRSGIHRYNTVQRRWSQSNRFQTNSGIVPVPESISRSRLDQSHVWSLRLWFYTWTDSSSSTLLQGGLSQGGQIRLDYYDNLS